LAGSQGKFAGRRRRVADDRPAILCRDAVGAGSIDLSNHVQLNFAELRDQVMQIVLTQGASIFTYGS